MAARKQRSSPTDLGTKHVLFILTAQAVVLSLLGLGLWHLSGRDLAVYITFDMRGILGGAMMGITAIGIAAASFRAFPRFCEKLVWMQSKTYDFLKEPLPFPAIVWISICAGFGEEALFRGGLQTILGDWMGAPFAIIISSLLFTAMHLSRPVISLILFLISLTFGYIYWQTGSLLLVMIGHALYDIFALSYLQREMQRLNIFAVQDSKRPDQRPAETRD